MSRGMESTSAKHDCCGNSATNIISGGSSNETILVMGDSEFTSFEYQMTEDFTTLVVYYFSPDTLTVYLPEPTDLNLGQKFTVKSLDFFGVGGQINIQSLVSIDFDAVNPVNIFGYNAKTFVSGGAANGWFVVRDAILPNILPYRVINLDSTVYKTDYAIYANAGGLGANITVTLPSCIDNLGRILLVKKVDNSANPVTIDGDGNTIDVGATTRTTTTPGYVFRLQATSLGWFLI